MGGWCSTDTLKNKVDAIYDMAATFQIKNKITPHLKEKWGKPTATVKIEFETVDDASYFLNRFNKSKAEKAKGKHKGAGRELQDTKGSNPNTGGKGAGRVLWAAAYATRQARALRQACSFAILKYLKTTGGGDLEGFKSLAGSWGGGKMKMYHEDRRLVWRADKAEGELEEGGEQEWDCLVAAELKDEEMKVVFHIMALNRTTWLKTTGKGAGKKQEDQEEEVEEKMMAVWEEVEDLHGVVLAYSPKISWHVSESSMKKMAETVKKQVEVRDKGKGKGVGQDKGKGKGGKAEDAESALQCHRGEGEKAGAEVKAGKGPAKGTSYYKGAATKGGKDGKKGGGKGVMQQKGFFKDKGKKTKTGKGQPWNAWLGAGSSGWGAGSCW